MLPWKLFGLTPRDQSGVLIRAWNQQKTNSLAALSITHTFNVPADQALILLNWSVVALGIGTQQPTTTELDFFETQSNAAKGFLAAVFPVSLNNASGTGIYGYINQPVNGVLVGPGSKIECNTAFSQAIFPNTCSVSICGVLIPRGDAAYV